MKPFLLVANWKMNGCLDALEGWVAGFEKAVLASGATQLPLCVLCVPSPYLCASRKLLELSEAGYLKLGAQDVSRYPGAGAYTGEYSASMLKDVGCEWVIVGHSERRDLFAESDASCASKFQQSLGAGLMPILCVGETASERSAGQAWDRVQAQLLAVLAAKPGPDCFAIAYEPVWAIGTGITPSSEQVQTMHHQIARYCEGALGGVPPILYGGSLNQDNARSLFMQPQVSGGLIGGASLKVESFLGIVKHLDQAKRVLG